MSKMRKKRVLVIGLGRLGTSLVDELFDTGVEVAVIDKSAAAVDVVKDKVCAAFVADGSDPNVLESAGAREMDVAAITHGEDFETTVLAVATLAQLKVPAIFARVATERQAAVLRSVGATRVVLVEHEMGRRLAPEILSPAAADLVDYASSFRVLPVAPRPEFIGKTLAELDLRRRFEITVLGYWRGAVAHGTRKPKMNIPTPDYRVQAGDTLLLIGLHDAVEQFLSS
ncbi:MAG: TrkA family potassium uptake protein [Myxococcales bacterium]|nr:TrkA family potassium uptake protein [Myxococcales bacterium]